ncbi:MAG: hypothetical protein QNJ98_18795 [Planctomycetota bacterium]|nr:hypothetical protein [Planctomycetota bacterium]
MRPRQQLVGVVVLMAGVYLLVWALHPGRADRVLRHAVTIGMTLALLALFVFGLRLIARDTEARRGWPLRGFVVLAFVALVVPAFQSSDVYAYGQIGWLQTHYRVNPYTTTPADLPAAEADPMFTSTWRDAPCIYGFLFALVARAVAWAGSGDPQVTIYLFKLLSALVWFAIGAVLFAVLARERPATVSRSLYWLLISPFVVLQAVANGHNDGLFALFLLLAFLAARADRLIWVLPALALATLVKWVALVTVPAALVFLVRRQGWGRTLGQAHLALLLTALIAAPYVLDIGAFDWDGIQAQLAQPSYSLLAAVGDVYATVVPQDAGSWFAPERFVQALQLMALLAFLCYLVVRLLRSLRAEAYDADAFVEDGVVLLFALIVFASAKLYPWYFLMLLPSVFLLPRHHIVRAMLLALTLSWMLVFTGVGKARILDALLMTALPLAFVAWRRRQNKPVPLIDG